MISMDSTLLGHLSSVASQRPMYWFSRHFGDERSPHLRSIEGLQITVSIADEVNKYLWGAKTGPSNPRLRYNGGVLGLYLRIPVEDWRDLSKEEFVIRFAAGIRSAFFKLVIWLRKHGELLDETAYVAEFERRMKLFKRDALKPMLSGHDMQYWESDRYKSLKAKGILT